MNESVELPGEPALTRNSLILTGLTFRIFSAAVPERFAPLAVHCAWPTRSPLKAAVPEMTLKVALALAPGATASAIVTEGLPPEATEVQPLGTVMLSVTAVAGA